MKKPLSLLIQIFVFSLAFASFSPSYAARIVKANNTQAIVDTEGDNMQEGTEYYSLNESGKKVSLLSVKKVKGGKALLAVLKGRATVGESLQIKGTSAKAADIPVSRRKYQLAGGVLLGFAQSNMSMTVQSGASSGEAVKMTDNSYNLKVFADYNLSPSLTVRGASGYETFAAKGTINQALCGGTSECHANYNYLPLEGSLHYNFSNGKTKTWVGLGYSFLIEMSRDVNIPNLNSESKTNQMILISGGADFRMGGKAFVPVVLEYATFPGSTNVTANALYLRAGYGFGF